MKGLLNSIIKNIEGYAIKSSWLEKLVSRYSLVGDSVFFENEQFPWAEDLEANWIVIRKELEEVLQNVDNIPNFQDIVKRQSRIAKDNLWKTYFFYAFGFKVKKNCDYCPKTTKLLEKIPGMKVAFFSILAPGKHIPEHRGKHKGIIRYHLGLIVPKPKVNCWIRIADQVAYWEEGKSLIFDDTFYHEVVNDTDGYRVVLFLDVARPLGFPISMVNWLVNRLIAASPMIEEAQKNHEHWERKIANRIEKEAGLNLK
ncbi:Aspartyl/asparaginyl beta-hydroxylase and related dioxygenases [Richelia intracellularis HM01]|nr:Aspartyl/asparaginyl beta-hydroxylase and related dioxygenases [Richelia intracellularis HM01]